MTRTEPARIVSNVLLSHDVKAAVDESSGDFSDPLCMRASAIILAGGRSSRMGGSDKAFMRIGGRPVIDRSLTLLRELFAEVIVVTNNPDKYVAYQDVKVVSDVFPYMGPLAGLFSGVLHATRGHVFAVACDMPFLRREPISFLGSVLSTCRDADAVVPVWEGDVEPLHAFYCTQVAPVAERLLRSGTAGLRELLAAIRVRYVTEDSLRVIPGAEETFRNVNTPADAARFAVEV